MSHPELRAPMPPGFSRERLLAAAQQVLAGLGRDETAALAMVFVAELATPILFALVSRLRGMERTAPGRVRP